MSAQPEPEEKDMEAAQRWYDEDVSWCELEAAMDDNDSEPLVTALARFHAAAYASGEAAGRKAERERCAMLCDKRSKRQRANAASIAEHYGGYEAGQEVSMYEVDASVSEVIASAIRRGEHEPKEE
jgi:hypothetical protein